MIQRIQTCVLDCFLYKPEAHYDDRGFVMEIYNESKYTEKPPSQINWSYSIRDVIRGLHISPYPKLVTCVQGSIYDVCLDVRVNSLTYGQYCACSLDDMNKFQLLIPAYCAHGFYSYIDSIVLYCQGGTYSRQERGIHYTSFDIKWPSPNCQEYCLSEKDKEAPIENRVVPDTSH